MDDRARDYTRWYRGPIAARRDPRCEVACLTVVWWRDCPVGHIGELDAHSRVLDRARLARRLHPMSSSERTIVAMEVERPAPSAVKVTVVICNRERLEARAGCLTSRLKQTAVMPVSGLVLPVYPETGAQRHSKTYWRFSPGEDWGERLRAQRQLLEVDNSACAVKRAARPR
jgi:hypothetical protein